MPALSLVFPLVIGPARAGFVHQPPPDTREVGILVCVDDCADRMFWVEHEPALRGLLLVGVQAILEQNTASVAQGQAAAGAFQDALLRARTSFDAREWKTAETALDDARRDLDGWRGTPPHQELFTLWFLRGAVNLAQGYSSATQDFRRAGTTAWNRSVGLPVDVDPYAAAYYAAVAELIQEPPGTLVLEAGGGSPLYSVDGIPLGAPPLRIELFPGVHRVTALEPALTQEWRREVTVASRRTTTARARFIGGDDPQWASDALSATIDTHAIPPELADLMSDWADRYGVRQVRLMRLDPIEGAGSHPSGSTDGVRDPLAGYTLHDVVYAPKERRFSMGP